MNQTNSNVALSTQASSSTISTSTTIETTDLQIQLFHDYHGDGQQQPEEPSITDLILDIQGIDNNYGSTLQAESDGKYWARKIPVGKSYRVAPKAAKFKYVAVSNAECRNIRDYSFGIASTEPTLRLGLMEGLLTLPYPNGTRYIVGNSYMKGRYYDRDPSPQKYLWWNGKSGAEILTGAGANHPGTDFGVDFGTPVVASAPGTVSYLGEDSVGGGLVVEINHHVDNLGTNYIHLSKQLVSLGQEVPRGGIIGLSGPGRLKGYNDVFQHTHFTLFYYGGSGVAFVDPFRSSKVGDPKFTGFVGDPGYWFSSYGDYGRNWILASHGDMRNLVNYWTKDNDPQYPAA